MKVTTWRYAVFLSLDYYDQTLSCVDVSVLYMLNGIRKHTHSKFVETDMCDSFVVELNYCVFNDCRWIFLLS